MTPDIDQPFSRRDTLIFGKCLERFTEMLDRMDREPKDEAVRDSVIKRFELTYELAVTTLQRYLLWASPSSTKIAHYDFQDLIRKADQAGVLRTGWPEWKKYREARNRTVHTYREEVAVQVAASAREFADEARVLLDRLNRRMDP